MTVVRPPGGHYGYTVGYFFSGPAGAKVPYTDQVVADLGRQGIGRLRVQIPQKAVEGSGVPGVYDWRALDYFVNACAVAGITMQYTIQQPPTGAAFASYWQTCSCDSSVSLPTTAAYQSYAVAVASRYNGVFSVPGYGPLLLPSMELGNEDFDKNSNPDCCRDLGGSYLGPIMVACVPAIHAVHPTCLVTPGCILKQSSTAHIQGWLADYFASGAGAVTPCITMHYYHSGGVGPDAGNTFLGFVGTAHASCVAAGYPNMPIRVTETGWPTTIQGHSAGDVVTPSVQWSYFETMLEEARGTGYVEGIDWYTIGNDNGDSLTQGGAVDGGTPAESWVQPTFDNYGAYAAAHPNWSGAAQTTRAGAGRFALALDSDSFARANQSGLGTASDGDTYTISGTSYTWAIAGNAATATGASSQGYALHGSRTFADVDVTCRFQASNAGASGGLTLRHTDVNNCYRMRVGNGVLNIGKVMGGSSTTPGTGTYVITANTWYRLRARIVTEPVTGNAILTLACWLDGAAESSATIVSAVDSTPLAAGSVGLFAYTLGTGRTDSWDSLLVMAAAPTARRASGRFYLQGPPQDILAATGRFSSRAAAALKSVGRFALRVAGTNTRRSGGRLVVRAGATHKGAGRFRLAAGATARKLAGRFKLKQVYTTRRAAGRFVVDFRVAGIGHQETPAPASDGKLSLLPAADGKLSLAPASDGKLTLAPASDGKLSLFERN